MSSKDKNEREKEKKKENGNENDKTLISSNDDDDDDDDDENENENRNENENDDETMDQNKKSKIIKGTNDLLDEIIDKSKSFEEQIKSLKKRDLKGYWPYDDFGDKALKSKFLKIELADMSNDLEEKLFEQIFGHTLETANKLINTTNKEENQLIVDNINKNKDKLCEQDDFSDWVIQPKDQCINLTIDLILDFNETIQLDLV